MVDSTFDAELFLNQSVEGESETRYTPIPEGDYIAMIDEKLAMREINDSPVLDVTYVIDDEELRAKLDMERLTVRQSIFLDIDETGNIALGTNKNVKLGRLREALGQNTSGQTWNPGMLAGAGPLKIKVIQRPDTNDPTIIYNDVRGTTSM